MAQAERPHVPPGYEKTPAGVIPEDWTFEPLGLQCERVTKGTTPTTLGRRFTDSGVLFFKAEAISEDGRPIAEKAAFIDEETHALLARSALKDGDLLISIAGVLGRVGRVLMSDLPANTNQALAIIRLSKHATISRDFLFWFLRGDAVQKRIRDINVQAAQANISLQDVRDFALAVPPSAEQSAIAEVLSDADGLLWALEALIAKKRAIKRAAMQHLLTGKIRLPGFSGKWQTKRMDDLAAVDPENLPSSTDPVYSFNYISLEQVDSGRLIGWSEEVFRTAPSRARRILRHDDVLMSTVRPNLMAHLHFRSQVANAVCSTGFAVLRARLGVAAPGFLFAHLFGQVVNQQIEKTLAGSNYPAINSGDVRGLELPCPPTVEEQRAIATVLSDMDAEIAALAGRRDKTRAIKQGMMQQLLNGRVRLVKPSPAEAGA
jgi:type I restriction enzyme S subunit